VKDEFMLDFLSAHAGRETISFHMPGHKGAELYRRFGFGDLLERIPDLDITEIPGADNLFRAEGVIARLQERYAALYGVARSHLLINGSSAGIVAAVLASVPRGGKLIMARNSHKSVFNALNLGDIRPVYAYPDIVRPHGVAGAIDANEIASLLREHPDASAVILPSPNYYGFCSDIEAIARATREANKALIVDQAHGAHLKFFGNQGRNPLPKPAEEQGADLVVNSTHKTLASFTQSAILNVCSQRTDEALLEDRLQAVESTSPSYILMASLDINARLLERYGAELIGEWDDNLRHFYRAVRTIDGIEAIPPGDRFDHTKINLDATGIELSGAAMERRLIRDRRIYPELYAGNLLMLMSGIGNTRRHYDALLEALSELARDASRTEGRADGAKRDPGSTPPYGRANAVIGGPAELFPIPTETERVPLSKATERVCAMSVIPYPPGIPLVCPGEKFSAEILRRIATLTESGETVIGIDRTGRVTVGL
jgi:lysine decarboxylase